MVQKQTTYYLHFSQEEREYIAQEKRAWKSFREIGRELWRSHTSVSREYKRNAQDVWRDCLKYSPKQAQKKYEQRRLHANRKHIILWRKHKMRERLIELVRNKWRERWLDEIIWRMKLEWYQIVSTASAYRFIRNEISELQKYLRYWEWWYRTRKKWNKRKKWYDDVPNISERPETVKNREKLGHWEWDTVVSWRKNKWWVVTMLERFSRYYLIKQIWNLKSETARITIEAMMEWEKIESATFDNWVEFRWISKLPFQCYRADPYASYQRWWNERHNWLFRRYVPKWSDIWKYSAEEILEIQSKINHKPRKILDYRSPFEVYHWVKLKYISKAEE